MSAPESVVRAVQEALGCEGIFGPNGAECGEHRFWDSRGCVHATEAADTAWVASLEAAAERLDEAVRDDIDATGEASIAQVVTTGIGVVLREWADEQERGDS